MNRAIIASIRAGQEIEPLIPTISFVRFAEIAGAVFALVVRCPANLGK
jgi:hypothetical protein